MQIAEIDLAISFKTPTRVFAAAEVVYSVTVNVGAADGGATSATESTIERFASVDSFDNVPPLTLVHLHFRAVLCAVVMH